VKMRNNIFLIEALDLRIENFRSEKKRCRVDFSEEAVHDYRVASRRLLSIVDLLRNLSADKELKKLHNILKNQLESLNNLRDTQMVLTELLEINDKYPELTLFRKNLEKMEKRFLNCAEKDIREINWNLFSKGFAKIKVTSLQRDDSEEEFIERLNSIVDEVYGLTLQRKSLIDPLNPSTIHRVRVVFKKFRYMVEIMSPVLPHYPKINFGIMHDYQAMLGEIQDIEVIIGKIREYSVKHSSSNLDYVIHYYTQYHQDSIKLFIDKQNSINTFWREAPGKEFPWNTAE